MSDGMNECVFSFRGAGEGDGEPRTASTTFDAVLRSHTLGCAILCSGNEWVMIAKDTQEREEWVGALNRCRNWEQRIRTDYERKLVLEQAAQHREEAHRSKVRPQTLSLSDRSLHWLVAAWPTAHGR